MTPTELSIIDIGSNSVRYGIYAYTDGAVTSRDHTLFTTRLGAELPSTGRLPDSAKAATLDVIAALAERGDAPIYAYATSAMRDAADGADFAREITAKTGVPVEILTGEQEAEYALAGATGGRGGLIDIGGASAQLSYEGFAVSFPAGCVRMKARLPRFDEEELRSILIPMFRFPRIRLDWFGAGGTITTLGALSKRLTAYDRCAVDGTRLDRETVRRLTKELIAMGDSRAVHPLLHERHDVILYGAAILAVIMDGLNIDGLTVSVADGMEGYYLHLLNR